MGGAPRPRFPWDHVSMLLSLNVENLTMAISMDTFVSFMCRYTWSISARNKGGFVLMRSVVSSAPDKFPLRAFDVHIDISIFIQECIVLLPVIDYNFATD